MANLYALPRLKTNNMMISLDNRRSLPANSIQMKLVVSFDEHHLNATFFRLPQQVSKGPEFSSEVVSIPKTEIENVTVEDETFHIICEASESIHEQHTSGIIESPQMDVGNDDELG
jgi:hypothetical protein